MKQREIKFRVWDGKEMREPPPLNEWDSHDGYMWSEYGAKGCIMQFTGLKDKNGKDIYEGDVFDSGGKRGSDKSAILYEVHWDDEDACWGFKQLGGFCLTGGIDKGEIGVVGNIHENPELLR